MVAKNDLDKAEVLIEALPYIKRFNGNIIVVKYGGSAMKDEDLMHHVIEDVALMKLIGFKPIIVHGGGKEISRWIERIGIKTEFYNGLRITDKDVLEVAEMVLGKVNSDLIKLAQSLGVNAVGISGIDSHLLTVKKQMPDGKDIGFVGEITSVNPEIIFKLLDDDVIPIIFPIGTDGEGQSYNINGDHAAAAIAQAIHAEKLLYLTDIAGVLMDPDDPDSLISELYPSEAEELINNGNNNGGMIPKVENCMESVRSGVRRVHILDGRIPHSVLLEVFTDKGIGTAFINDEEGRYFQEKK